MPGATKERNMAKAEITVAVEKAVQALKRGSKALRIRGPSSSCCACDERFVRGGERRGRWRV